MPAGPNTDLGLYDTTPGLLADGLDVDLVPAMDVRNYKWLALYVGPDAYVGTLSFQVNFDVTNDATWQDTTLFSMTSLSIAQSGVSTTTTNVYVGTSIWFPYFRVRMTAYTSGGATGILQLSRDAVPIQLSVVGASLFASQEYFGLINNDGRLNTPIASGHSSDTVVSAVEGMLASVLVTTTNTHEMDIYDNSSTGSGTIIGIIPASAPVDGVPFVFHAPAANGITVKGNANNPGVTIFHA